MAQKINNNKSSQDDNSSWWLIFGIICLLTFVTRFYKVTEPDHVCWDETHFGKMGSWYINRTFFFDVHPPLGKMLIGLSGYLTGYDGTFPFDKPGDKYENTSYVGMRAFCTALGATLVPMSFLAVDEMTGSLTSATFASLLILFDVGILTLTQYILLDPILLCFIMASVLGAVKVSSTKIQEFSLKWMCWLIFTGTMLACCFSVKFVGLFVILLVGLMTLADLWMILGDLTRPVIDCLKHLLVRGLFLIVWPVVLYIAFFYIHLRILNKSGNGDGFYSSAFQSQLIGNSLHDAQMPLEIAYGAIITLKNHKTGGGYLHSHLHLYPENVGAKQQQITTYTHKDDNNKWKIKKFDREDNGDKVELVKSGDLVRLEHVSTGRNLHSHKEQAPITKKHLQVTGYGENGRGDANDVWKILVVGGKDGDPIRAVNTKLKFIHYLQSCILTTSGKQLPKWAYEQQEVGCNPNLRDANGVWNVEENIFDKLPNVSFNVYAPTFLERFIESHLVMLQGNAGLKPKEGEITSRPWQWPINYRGQFFSGSTYRIYLLGNPIIWWINLILLIAYLLIFITNSIKCQRNGNALEIDSNEKRKLTSCLWLFIGWLLHYVPFWAMGRVLYFHHYFPALLFSSMLSGILFDLLLDQVKKVNIFHSDENDGKLLNLSYHLLSGLFLSTILYSFYLFAPLSYGMSGPSANESNSTMFGLKWLDTWEF